jgi:ectoine hydroxylase-related dioxygenase (phytanoyl-CoA dioxygenase family)
MIVNPEEIYRRDGFVFPIPVLSADVAATTARIVDNLAAACRIQPIRLPFPHRFFRWAFDLATHPALLDVVERIVGPDILIWGTLILSKPAGSRSTAGWHQDCAYATFLDGAHALSAWIALTPSTSDSGCMRVIPGSYGERLPFTTAKDTDDMLSRGARVTADFDQDRAVDLELRPGEASLHEVSVIHGSNANRSGLPRTGFIVRFATPAIRQPDNPVYCVRGRPGAIHCEAPPETELDEGLDTYLDYLHSEAEVQAGAS